MSAPVPARSSWPFVAAGLAALAALGVALGVVARILSPSVWLDVIALWPIPALGTVVALVSWLLTRRRRHLAMIGLSVFTWLALGVALHLSGAPWLPVAAATLVGPVPLDASVGRLVIDLPNGLLALTSADAASYTVSPIRAGGDVAAPVGYEQQRGVEWTAVVVPRPDAGLFRFEGWEVGLTGDLTWSLEVSAPEMDVDLTGLALGAVAIASDSARIRLGEPTSSSTLTIEGAAVLEVPATVPFRLTGTVTGPEGWPTTGGGLTSPAGPDGWVITVSEGSQVQVVER